MVRKIKVNYQKELTNKAMYTLEMAVQSFDKNEDESFKTLKNFGEISIEVIRGSFSKEGPLSLYTHFVDAYMLSLGTKNQDDVDEKYVAKMNKEYEKVNLAKIEDKMLKRINSYIDENLAEELKAAQEERLQQIEKSIEDAKKDK